MTEQITLEIEETDLERARKAAEAQGVATETYLRQLIADNLPISRGRRPQQIFLAKIFGMGSSAEPTDIAKDKDKLLGEAVSEEYARETKRE